MEGVDELLDSSLTLEELSSVWLDDVAASSEELLGVSATEEEIPGGISTEDELLGGIAIEDELYGLITPLEEIIGNLNEELLNFSAELLVAADEESAFSAMLLRCSWLSGISIAEELDDSVVLPVLSGSAGLMGAPDSASLRHPLKNTEVMPSNEATPTFAELDKLAFPATFFFSIFINDFLLTFTTLHNILLFGI